MKNSFKMFRLLLLSLTLSLFFVSCNEDTDEVVCGENPCEPCNLSEEVAALYDQLNEMYENDCVHCLEDFLETWQAKYPPRVEIPETDRWLHEIYQDVYTPWNLSAFTKMDTMNHFYYKNELNQGMEYYIINDNFYTSEEYKKFFQPMVTTEQVQVLYLRPEYQLALSCFLNFFRQHSSEYPQNFGGVQLGVLNLSIPELTKRVQFLENYIKVTPRWFYFGSPYIREDEEYYIFNYYNLDTQPWIAGIYQMSDTTAWLDVIIGNFSWDTKVAKTEDGWKPVEIRLTGDDSLM